MISDDPYEKLKLIYLERKDLIKARLTEFQDVLASGDDKRIFKELAFCILTSAAGPKMGQASIDAINGLLMNGSESEVYETLQNIHKYPEKASYIVHTREYLKRELNFKLKDLVRSFKDPIERRDFFANNKNIKGIGYLQASHFLRNIGFTGYSILDKNIIKMLYEFGVVDSFKPPTTKKKYIEIENKVKVFSDKLGIGIDELDLLLWSVKTGHIPR
ncbi:MAG: DNA lyase [Candidatus Dadabacteria bacterium]|nr:DNA lyase [Candidatus Dadabacteria bacterium]